MTTTSKPATPGIEPDRLPRVLRALAVVERIGNALPHPFWLFWILAGILGVTSAALAAAGVSVVSPADGETVVVQNLLSGDGLAMAVSTAVDNFATFGPMGTIVAVIMGVAIAERQRRVGPPRGRATAATVVTGHRVSQRCTIGCRSAAAYDP